tara:strand:- start:243 stop:425 length:183 start_codon:yes stop_codon:yes gene_type:complete
MNTVILEQKPIIIELGGMQITREELDNIKLKLETNSDAEAINHLIVIAERAFSQYVETNA